MADASTATLLVTGATGFLGRRLAQALAVAGVGAERLRLLVRDPARAAGGLPPATLSRGDLADPDGRARFVAAARGVDVVVHLAGSLKAFGPDGYDAVNVAGTARFFDAVAEVAPNAFVVHVSSLAAAGPSVDGRDSAAPPGRCRPVSNYGRSKLGGEAALLASGLAHCIVRPPVVYGPEDAATRLLFRQALAPLVPVPRRAAPLSVIHADDVVAALLAAIARRPVGSVVALDGPERTDTHQLSRRIAAACGRRARLVPVPLLFARAAASVGDLVARWRGVPGYFNRDKVREIAAPGWVADGETARQVLGVAARVALDDGLRQVAEAEGLVPLG
ncbi:MAG: hypothetical protein RL398_2721 [Planctomycetota bacterium]|jgi:nucleoside-diphosphate-sugar epimerase